MTLYVPSGSENTITDTYLRQFWSESCGYSGWCGGWQRQPEPGWHPDPSFQEIDGGNGTHGGCSNCIMTLSQVIANYQTEVTFISNPPGAQILIDGVEWWPGTVTAADGATFRGIPPGTNSYEMRMHGYRSATGTFDLVLDTPITISGTLRLMIGLADSAWPKFRFDIENTGQSQFSSYANYTFKWATAPLGPPSIATAPVIATDGTIYFGVENSNLYAINLDGTPKWISTITGNYAPILLPPAIGSDGTIYVSCNDRVFAISPDGNSKLWDFQVSGHGATSPTIDSLTGFMYIANDSGNLFAIDPFIYDPPTGAVAWQYTTPTGATISSCPAISPIDRTIYFGDTNGDVYAIDPTTHAAKWFYHIGKPITTSPAVDPASGNIYITAYDTLFAIEDHTTYGSLSLGWPYRPFDGKSMSCSPAIASDGTIFVTTDSPSIDAINPDGTRKWEVYPTDINNNPKYSKSSISITASGLLMIGFDNGDITGYNKDNGAQLWNYTTTMSVISSPVIASDGTIYTTNNDGILYAFGPTAILDISSTPSGASISIDGEPQGVTETIITGLTVATHTALLKLPGYIDRTISFDIALGQKTTISTTLSPISDLLTDVTCTSYKFHKDLRNSGQSTYPSYAGGSIKWTYPTNYNYVRGSPAIDVDGTIYIGDSSGKFYAINPDGTLKWTYPSGGSQYSSPVIGNDGIIYTFGPVTEGYGLYAFNPDGILKWLFYTGGWGDTVPTIGLDGNIYVGTSYGPLYAIDHSGNQIWVNYTNMMSTRNSSPAVSPIDGTIYAKGLYGESYNSFLCAFSPSDGNIIWSTPIIGDQPGGGQSPSIAEDGTIYIAAAYQGNCYLYAIKSDGSNKINWPYIIGTNQTDSTPAIATDGTIYIGNNDYNDYKMYAINPNGTLKWSYPVINSPRSPPTIDLGGNIYFGTDGTYNPTFGNISRFYALNPDGTLRWYRDIPTYDSIVSSPSIAPDGTIYVGVDSFGDIGLVAFRSTYITPPTLADYMFKLCGYADILVMTEETENNVNNLNSLTLSPTSTIVNLDIYPSETEIYIDGVDHGIKTPASVIIGSIPGYVHTFTFRKYGYFDYIRTETLVGEGPITISGDMTPLIPIPPCVAISPVGKLSFTSSPAGAEIFIDGADQNVTAPCDSCTPLVISNIATGNHSVTLTLTGYIDYIETVYVVTGATTAVTTVLIANIACSVFDVSVQTDSPNMIYFTGTWINNGGTTGTFTPSITIDDTVTDLGLGVQTLVPGISYTSPTIPIAEVPEGSHTVCVVLPNPDGSTPCQIVVVTAPAPTPTPTI